MIYEFEVKDISKAVIPVRADNIDDAIDIFDNWYNSYEGSKELHDLLCNGYEGHTVKMKDVPISEDKFSPDDILLPKEEDKPPEPQYVMHIRFKDESNPWYRFNMNSSDLAGELKEWNVNYILIPEKVEKIKDVVWLWYLAIERYNHAK